MPSEQGFFASFGRGGPTDRAGACVRACMIREEVVAVVAPRPPTGHLRDGDVRTDDREDDVESVTATTPIATSTTIIPAAAAAATAVAPQEQQIALVASESAIAVLSDALELTAQLRSDSDATLLTETPSVTALPAQRGDSSHSGVRASELCIEFLSTWSGASSYYLGLTGIEVRTDHIASQRPRACAWIPRVR